MASLEQAIHDYLDRLEDLQVDAAAQLVQAIGRLAKARGPGGVVGVDAILSGLSRPDGLRNLAAVLARDLYPVLEERGQKIALGILSADDSEGMIRGLDDLAATIRARGYGLLAPTVAAMEQGHLASSINDRLQMVGVQVRAALQEGLFAGGGTEDAARGVVARLRAEILAGDGRGPAGSLLSESEWATDLRAPVGQLVDHQTAAGHAEVTGEDEAAQRMVWVAALVRTCPDCLVRHGRVETMAEWVRLGLPRSGTWPHACGGRCRCMLMPSLAGKQAEIEEFIDETKDTGVRREKSEDRGKGKTRRVGGGDG